MNIFPETILTQTEEDILTELYSNPTVIKHLHMLAYNIGRDLVSATPKPGETAENWMRKEAHMKGQLAILDTLVSISINALTINSKE